MVTSQLLSLVEYLAYKANCEYISDLPHLDVLSKTRAHRALENVEPDMYSLAQWNDALAYIVSGQPCSTSEEARAALSKALQV